LPRLSAKEKIRRKNNIYINSGTAKFRS